MTTIKTNDRELVAVEVPVGAANFYINSFGELCHYAFGFPKILLNVCESENDVKIIGLLSDLTEQQAAEYVSDADRLQFSHFGNKGILITILHSQGLTTSAPILLIEKVK